MSKPTATRPIRLLLGAALAAGLVAAPSLVLASASTDQDRAGSESPAAEVATPTAPTAAVPAEAVAAPGDVTAPTDGVPPASAVMATATDEPESDEAPTGEAGTDEAQTEAVPSEADERRDRPEHDRPLPRLGCEAQRSDAGPVVGCKWTPAGPDRAAGYRLLRAVDDRPRTVIFETRDLAQNGYRDVEVGPGHQFHYAVQYLAEDGSVIVTSAPAHVRIPGDEPRPERLRLACEQVESDVEHGAVVACKWSQATSDQLAGYRLVRTDGDGREVIARGGREFTAHRDHVRPGRYAYRVVGVDRDGKVIAASEAVGVFVPRPEAGDRPDAGERPAAGDRPTDPAVG